MSVRNVFIVAISVTALSACSLSTAAKTQSKPAPAVAAPVAAAPAVGADPAAAAAPAAGSSPAAGTSTSFTPPTGGPWIDNSRIPSGIAGASGPVVRAGEAIGPGGDGVGAFRISCRFSHMAYDDPIVAPGRPGASHLHSFFGNTALSGNTTAESIRTTGNSTCDGGTLNRSGYWVPSIIDSASGTPIAPDSLTVYYKSGYGGVQANEVTVPPSGLRMIAGVASATAPVGAEAWDREVSWTCQDGSASGTPPTAGIQQCAPGQLLRMEIKFPQCWDGVNLDSANHKSHMARTVEGGCPGSHPVALPEITYGVFWSIPAADTSSWRLASDMYTGGVGGYSGHGDWFNGWDEATLQAVVQNCVQAGNDCHMGNLGDGRLITWE